MNTLDNVQSFEKIDNERKEINWKLDLKEKSIAIEILNKVDANVPFDIDLIYNNQNKKYYFIWNEKISLNIPLKFKDLNKIWDILIKIWNKDIQLFWDLYWRTISENTWLPNLIENEIVSNKKANLSKNEIEELFIFIMKVKWIPINDWQIDDSVCKNSNPTDECKNTLWNRDK